MFETTETAIFFLELAIKHLKDGKSPVQVRKVIRQAYAVVGGDSFDQEMLDELTRLYVTDNFEAD